MTMTTDPPSLPGPSRPARVLVTGAGGPAAVSFMRAVASSFGAGVELWAYDVDPCAVGLYLVPAGRRGLLPMGDAPEFADVLVEVCDSARIDVVVPTVDTEMLPVCHRRDELASRGTTVLAPSVATLETCLDKWTLAQVCAGRPWLPRTELLVDGFDASSWSWPTIVKPRHGSGSRGIVLVHGPDELDALPHDGSLLVQEELPGVEHSIDVLAYADGSVAAAVPRCRLKVDSGIAVAGRTEHDPVLEALAREVATAIGLSSVANVQVKADASGCPKLLEVNPRFPGSMPLTVASGVDMPTIALSEALGLPVPAEVGFRDLATVRFWEDVFVPVEEGHPVPLTAGALAEEQGPRP